MRKPFQGVLNIIRFNWHSYALALLLIILLSVLTSYLPIDINIYIYTFIAIAFCATALSLLVSFYIYDSSELYNLNWLNDLSLPENANILNINAGFDETSYLLKLKYPNADLKIFDFYNPLKHTEISIERARKAYAPYAGTQLIDTNQINVTPNSADCIFLIFAAHEIRDKHEQITFFKQLKEVLKKNGKIIVVEHNRDLYNFLVYNFGAFHFFSPKRWRNVFFNAGLKLVQTKNITPFINVYYLT